MISLSSILAVALIGGLYFNYTYQHDMQQTVKQLKAQSLSRIERERWPFIQAEQNTQLLAEAFTDIYQRSNFADLLPYYEQWVEATDGIHRLRPALAHGLTDGPLTIRDVSGFIGRYEAPHDDEFKARVVIATRLLAQYGPAWQHDFANTHISMPENTLLLYSPNHHWGLLADSNLDIRNGAVIAATLQANNPERKPEWTGLYYDQSADFWAITYQRPVDIDGYHRITPSHDLYLSDVIERMITPEHEQTQHFLFNQYGQLIARQREMTESAQQAGVMRAERMDSPLYSQLFELISQQPPSIENPSLQLGIHEDHIVLATLFTEPNWWYVTMYPADNLHNAALRAAIWQLLQGLSILLIILLLVYVFIQRQVSTPLKGLVAVTERIAEGRYRDAISRAHNNKAKNEVGLLNRTMAHMAERMQAHEAELHSQIEQRTFELAQANANLDALVHVDGLTGALNRRALDRDLDQAVSNQQPFSLILCDVDFFKAYNDHQGHIAGDKVLKHVVAAMRATTDANVYRYGGEEIAILCHSNTEPEDCLALAERLRIAVQQLTIAHPQGVAQIITISAGVALYQDGNAEQLISAADKALYVAKQRGRNQVALASA